MKVKAIMQALQSHDRVAWIDADVVIVDGSASIFDERGSNWQAIVEHVDRVRPFLNCGVWALTQPMLPVLVDVWNSERHVITRGGAGCPARADGLPR
jgi:hypothetical protein